MSQPKAQDLQESIRQLSDYRARLEKEVLIISQKLKIPPKKINSTIDSHKELNQIKKILSQLIKHQENLVSNLK